MSEKQEVKTEQTTPKSGSSLVFISHDTRDAEIAEAFSILLKRVSAGVLKSFRSSDKKGNQGIAYGVQWYPEIMTKLNEASDVVALLTHHSVDRPWILYEAGVAKGKLDTPLLGVAIGIPLNNANNGPFSQFQNSGDDVDSLTKLVVQLVQRIPNAEPDRDVIQTQVEEFKKKAEKILALQPKDEEVSNEIMEDSTVAQLFEEIKIMFQDLPSRIKYDNRDVNKSDKQWRHNIHMLRNLMHESILSEDNYFGFLMMLSVYKERVPWIYDIGKEVYMKLSNTDSDSEKEMLIAKFRRMVKDSIHHTIFFEMNGSKDDRKLLEELLDYMNEFLHAFK